MPNLCVPALLENLNLVTTGQRPHTAPLDAAPSHGLSGVPLELLPAKQSGRALCRKVRVPTHVIKELLPFHSDAFHCSCCFFSLTLDMNLVRGVVRRTVLSVHIQRDSQLWQNQPSFKTEAFALILQAGHRVAQCLSSRRQEGRQPGLATPVLKIRSIHVPFLCVYQQCPAESCFF